MPDGSQSIDNLDAKLAQDSERIKHEVLMVDELREICFLPGLEESVGYFPILESSSVRARFSYGFNAPNMSSVFFDSSKGESEVTGDRNTRIFLESQKFDSEKVIQVLGKFEGNEPQIEEVSLDTLKDKKKSVGNVVITRDPRLGGITIKMADCPSGTLESEDADKNPLTGILHGGAASLVYGLVRQGLTSLNLELGVDLSRTKLAIYPGMKDYTLSRFWKTPSGKIERRYDGLYPINVGGYLAPAKTDDPLELRVVDLTSIFIMQALQAGIKPENIQVYRVDTYADAARGRAYSRRWSNDHDGARPGGNLLAVRLKAA